EVQSAKNPFAFNAKQWLTNAGKSVKGDAWGEQPISKDPATALTVGRAWLAQAAQANVRQAYQARMSAASELRNGVLGLSSSEYEDQFVDNGPALYMTYATTLYNLNLFYHAALVSQEGLRAIRSRITDKKNPWKNSNGEWTQSGK